MIQSMKKLCSRKDDDNDNENELEMVLEVSMPEEEFTKTGTNATKRWQSLFNLIRPQKDRAERWLTILSTIGDGPEDIQFMYFLKIAGTSFIPLQVQLDHAASLPVKDGSMEASTAKYIIQQYTAATGGLSALNSVSSMYVVGEVNMVQGQIREDVDDHEVITSDKNNSESGAYMLWEKNPNLWFLELVVSGCRVSAGSDGRVTWSQSSLKPSKSSKGPPRPLRRFFQGLDPRSTANLFLNAVCIGEKEIMDEDCFILKLETNKDILNLECKANMETAHHIIQGYFSQKTGLLIQLEDNKLVKIKSTRKGRDQYVYYETSMESSLEDYRYVEGVNIAHYGKNVTLVYRYGQGTNAQWKVEETCTIKELEFNICGLAVDSFLPPPDV